MMYLVSIDDDNIVITSPCHPYCVIANFILNGTQLRHDRSSSSERDVYCIDYDDSSRNRTADECIIYVFCEHELMER